MNDVVERADIQARYRARFALAAVSQRHVVGQMCRHYLDGDDAIESRIPGAVDLPHPADAERGEDLVRAEMGSGLYGHAGISGL
jgi:hypothetical protein